MISKKLIEFIIVKEVTSKEYYTKHYTRGEWPGLKSGITIGIGYDLGYNTKADIERDWSKYLPKTQVNILKKYAAINDIHARRILLHAQKEIYVPWVPAIMCFEEIVLPKWIKKVTDSLPNTEMLSADCLGVLVSLAYNRGPAWNIPEERDPEGKYVEMRNIKTHMANKEFYKIPNELLAMKRLWKLRGLHIRRDEEAKFFEEGIKSPCQNLNNML